jgi:Domain of unknown function (DUF222)/HNH endonuclease
MAAILPPVGALEDLHGDADIALDSVLSAADMAERGEIDLLDRLVRVLADELFRRDGASSLIGWLRRRLGLDVPAARRMAHTVRVLLLLPGLRSALVSGSTTLSHLRVLERVATEERHQHLAHFADQLVGYACSIGVDDFRSVCERWADLVDTEVQPRDLSAGHLAFSPTLFGQADVRGRLSADQAAVVGEVLSQMNKPDPADAPVKRTHRQRNADALADLAQHYLDCGSLDCGGLGNHEPRDAEDDPGSPRRASRSRARAVVVIDFDALTDSIPELWDDERRQPVLDRIRRSNAEGRPLPAEVAALLVCDGSLQRLVVDSNGRPLDLGRATPVVSTAQRTALAVRDGGCGFPTCDRPGHHCDAHHLRHWRKGGSTNLDNLVLLCRHHHRLVHGPWWDIGRDPTTGVVTAERREPGSDRVVTYRRDSRGVVFTS